MLTRLFYCVCFILFVSCTNIDNTHTVNGVDTLLLKENLKKADSFLVSEQYSKAKLYFDTLIAIDSSRGGFYFKRGYARSLLLHTSDDNYMTNIDSVISDYKTAIRRNYSQKEYAFYNAGVIYSSIGQYDSAIAYFDECLKINPNNVKANKEKECVLNLLKLNNH